MRIREVFAVIFVDKWKNICICICKYASLNEPIEEQ